MLVGMTERRQGWCFPPCFLRVLPNALGIVASPSHLRTNASFRDQPHFVFTTDDIAMAPRSEGRCRQEGGSVALRDDPNLVWATFKSKLFWLWVGLLPIPRAISKP